MFSAYAYIDTVAGVTACEEYYTANKKGFFCSYHFWQLVKKTRTKNYLLWLKEQETVAAV